MKDEHNYADDFSKIIQGETYVPPRGFPPIHPDENKTAPIKFMEPEEPITNLFETKKNRKMIARFRQFILSDPAQVLELEEIENKCMQGIGWILAREEWDTDDRGNKIVTIKYLEPIETPAKSQSVVELKS